MLTGNTINLILVAATVIVSMLLSYIAGKRGSRGVTVLLTALVMAGIHVKLVSDLKLNVVSRILIFTIIMLVMYVGSQKFYRLADSSNKEFDEWFETPGSILHGRAIANESKINVGSYDVIQVIEDKNAGKFSIFINDNGSLKKIERSIENTFVKSILKGDERPRLELFTDYRGKERPALLYLMNPDVIQ